MNLHETQYECDVCNQFFPEDELVEIRSKAGTAYWCPECAGPPAEEED